MYRVCTIWTVHNCTYTYYVQGYKKLLYIKEPRAGGWLGHEIET